MGHNRKCSKRAFLARTAFESGHKNGLRRIELRRAPGPAVTIRFSQLPGEPFLKLTGDGVHCSGRTRMIYTISVDIVSVDDTLCAIQWEPPMRASVKLMRCSRDVIMPVALAARGACASWRCMSTSRRRASAAGPKNEQE